MVVVMAGAFKIKEDGLSIGIPGPLELRSWGGAETAIGTAAAGGNVGVAKGGEDGGTIVEASGDGTVADVVAAFASCPGGATGGLFPYPYPALEVSLSAFPLLLPLPLPLFRPKRKPRFPITSNSQLPISDDFAPELTEWLNRPLFPRKKVSVQPLTKLSSPRRSDGI